VAQYTLEIKSSLPTLNQYVEVERGNRYAAAKLKRDTEIIIRSFINPRRKVPEWKYPVTMSYVWFLRNRRKDPSNVAYAKKFIEDALVRAGVLEGDGFKHICGFEDQFIIGGDEKCIVKIKDT
jgi:hypothetical protein